jgi:tetratricopeptide (TPR) repeat protein
MVGHGRELKTKELKPYFEMFMQTKNLVLKAIKNGKSPEETKKSGVLKDWEKWNSTIFPTTHTSNNWIDNLYSALDDGKELSAYQTLKKIYDQSGLGAMILKYREICSSKKQYFLENDFNNWGYALLTGNKISDAIEVFKINTAVFPESANVWDSLGEAYMTNGEKDLAIKNYKKSLELNPDNGNAKNMINNMQSDKQ